MAVIGTGGMGKAHCRMMAKAREMKLVAVVDARKESADTVASEFKVKPFYSHHDLIKSGLCDAVIVATPHPLHPEIAIDCIKGGLDVISEKPLAEKISSAEKMVKVAKKHKRVLAVMFQRRFEPQLEAALNLVKSGALGKIHRATLISPEFRSQAYYNSGSWRATWEFEGGGVMMNQSPHIIDIFINLVGLPKKVRGTTAAKMHDIEVEDFAEATMTLKDGGSAYFYCSTNEPLPGQMIEIFAENGKLVLRDSSIQYWKYKEPISVYTKTTKTTWGGPEAVETQLKLKKTSIGHVAVLRNFARHILQGEELLCSGESGLASLELANAITLSSFLKEEVKLPISRKKYDDLLKHLRAESRGKKSSKRKK